jgi:hypothetical protein
VAIPVVERYEAHCIAADATVNPALALKLKLLKVHQLNFSRKLCFLVFDRKICSMLNLQIILYSSIEN